jgi:hypothetical protein
LQSGALVERKWKTEDTQAFWVRKRCEQEFSEEAVWKRARTSAFSLALDLTASVFDELVVFDAGRAGGHACHAPEAAVDVRLEDIVERGFAEGGFTHEPDASAWRVHLFAPEDISRTGGEAEAAVHALVHDGGLGCVV